MLWGLIALQSFVFAFDFPIAYKMNSIQDTALNDIKKGRDESVINIFYVIDIFPENNDRDHETMDHEIFEPPKDFKTGYSFFISKNRGYIDYKIPYLSEIFYQVLSPPPEQYYYS